MHNPILILIAAAMLAGCAISSISGQDSPAADPQALLGKIWQWEEFSGDAGTITVPEPVNYTILLKPDGRAQIRFDCNRGGGSYSLSGEKLSFGPLVSTRMACSRDSLDTRFARYLEQVESFYFQDGMLFLNLASGSGTLRFSKAGE